MNIPTELISLLGCSLFGALFRLWGLSLESRRQERLHAHANYNMRMDHIKTARAYSNRGFQWTRRAIALTATVFIIALPKITAIIYPEIPIHYGYQTIKQGFLFFSDIEKLKWVTLKGLVITPLDTHLLSAIIGLYFGGSLIGK